MSAEYPSPLWEPPLLPSLPLTLPLSSDAANGRISPPRRNPGDSAREVARTVTVAVERIEEPTVGWSLSAEYRWFQQVFERSLQDEAWLKLVEEHAGSRWAARKRERLAQREEAMRGWKDGRHGRPAGGR